MTFRCFRRSPGAPALAALLLLPVICAHAQPFAVPTHREDGNLVFDGVPPPDPALDASLARYEQWRAATFLDWTSGGAMLIATRFGRAAQVHRVAAPLGMREQLTFGEGAVIAARGQPGGSDFVFTRRIDGHPQIYLYESHAAVRALTHGPYRHGGAVWSRDGRRIAFYGTDRTGVTYDIYVVGVRAGSRPRLVAAGQSGRWRPCDWSVDGADILVLDRVAPEKSILYSVNVASGALTPILAQDARIPSARFAPNGVGVYFLSDAGGQFQRLWYYNPITHAMRPISSGSPWSVDQFAVSPHGGHLAYVVDDDGRSRLTVLDPLHHLALTPPGLQSGVISHLRFDATGHRLGFSYQSSREPQDAYVYDVQDASLTRWTESETGPLEAASFAPAHLVHFPTWDRIGLRRRTLSAYVYLPRGPQPCPVLILLHGRHAAQFRPGWHPFLQFIVNDLGYAVIAPNVRGSAGFGRDFRALGADRLRDGAVRDVGALLVWIGLQPGFDSKRVAVMGESYGGLLALDSLATYDGHLEGAIDVAGLANPVDFIDRAAAAERTDLTTEFGEDDIAQIRRPVLVVRGLDDPGVRGSDSQQLVWRLRSQGDLVWSLSAKSTGEDLHTRFDHEAYLDTAAQFLRMLSK
jgi:dipeptidyl aminopeptidase/acylaminoacyl peptidase